MKKNNNNLIVIAEDSPTQAEQLRHILTKNGYRVLHGRNGKDAFDLTKRERPEMVISDIMMPEINGYELCKAIKTDDQLKGIPVILLTVLSDSAEVIKGLECGADNFITKPYNEKYLLSRIHNILRNKELRKERLSEMGIEIFFANKKYYVNSDRLQILDLLLSTYENSIQKNRELIQVNEKLKSTRDELETLNRKLEETIEGRTLRLKHINKVLVSIRNVNQLIVREKDEGKLIKSICSSLVTVRGYDSAWILLFDENMNLLNYASKGIGKEFSLFIKNIENGKLAHCCQEALKQTGIVLACSQKPECSDCPVVKKDIYRESMTIRLEHDGDILGFLTIKLSPDLKTDKEEHDLLYEVAGDISFALYSINLEEKHRQAEDAFRKSEEKYKMLFEDSPEGILVADIETRKFSYANPALCKMLGYTKKEFEGMSIADIHPKDSLEHVISEFEAQARGEKTLAHDIPCLRKDGAIIYANINSSKILIDNRNCNIGFFTDTTEIKEVELKLAREKELLSALIDNSPDNIYFKDKQSRFLKINNKMAEWFGLKDPSEAMGKTDFDIFTGEHASQSFKDEQEIIKTGLALVNKEEMETLPDGSERWVSSSKLPLYGTDRDIMGTCGISRDITERKQAEEKFRSSEERLQILFDHAPDAYYLNDLKGNFIDGNIAAEKLLGHDKNELIGKSFLKLNLLSPKQLPRAARLLIKNALGQTTGPDEFAINRKDGSKVTVEIITHPVKIKGKTLVLGIARDITNRKRAEEELILAKEKAEESDRLKSAFLANMSHEIRTPMNALLGFSSLLADPEITDERRNEFIPRIRESGDRLLHLIDDIIDSSKIEAGQLRIREVGSSVNKIITEVCSFFDEQKHKKGKENIEIRLNKEISGEYLKILTDPYRLKQVLSNLLDNALKFTDSGYIETGYTVLPAPVKGSQLLRFYVKDTGIGIPENKKDFIFERFHKIEDQKVKLYEGAGLGLAISKNLVKLLGGEIWAESEPGKGSTFYFTLPYKPVHAVQEDIDVKDKIIKDFSGRTNNLWKDKVILIAEDDENNYSYIKEVLTSTCVKLIRAENGQEAVEICRSDKNIDLVLMDVKMPLVDGYTATKSIKSFRKNLPVIALTAYAGETEKEDSRKAGCDDYLSKPVKSYELLEMINKCF